MNYIFRNQKSTSKGRGVGADRFGHSKSGNNKEYQRDSKERGAQRYRWMETGEIEHDPGQSQDPKCVTSGKQR